MVVMQLDNCGLSDVTLGALRARGITSLFPIQKHVYEPANSGRDLIGRAKTGSGKTLAFALPVIEKIMKVSCSFHLHPSHLFGTILLTMQRRCNLLVVVAARSVPDLLPLHMSSELVTSTQSG